MTGQNDLQDESLTSQVRNQAGHCPLTGRYFQPWAIWINWNAPIGKKSYGKKKKTNKQTKTKRPKTKEKNKFSRPGAEPLTYNM